LGREFDGGKIALSFTDLNQPLNRSLAVNRENGELAGLREASNVNHDDLVL